MPEGSATWDESQPSGRNDSCGLALAFLAACALHGSILALALSRHAAPLEPPGEQQITIDLAPEIVDTPTLDEAETQRSAGSQVEEAPTLLSPTDTPAAPPATSAEPQPVAASVETQLRAPETETMKAPGEVVTLSPSDVAPIESTAPEATAIPATPVDPARPQDVAAIPPPETLAARVEVPRTVERGTVRPEMSVDKPRERQPEKPRVPAPRARQTRDGPAPATTARAGNAGSSNRDTSGASSRENATGTGAAGNFDAQRRYLAQVSALIQRRVAARYSEGSRTSVTARLKITIARSGQVLSSQVLQSSGRSDLDQLALSAAGPGAQMPAFPDAVAASSLTIGQNIRFDSR